jgi:hypothetical protein
MVGIEGEASVKRSGRRSMAHLVGLLGVKLATEGCVVDGMVVK